MICRVHMDNPQKRILNQISEGLLEGKIYIVPTDSVYALVADSTLHKAVNQLYQLKNLPRKKPLALLVKDIGQAAEYVDNIPNESFRLMKKIVPGPVTFVFRAGKGLPRFTLKNSNTIGIRIPANPFLQALLETHPHPLTSTSVSTDDQYIIETEELDQEYGKKVAAIVDGGIVTVEMSTVLDMTGDVVEVLREGKKFEEIEALFA